ncbi:MAG: HAD family hydrolase [Candidatus Cryptobacteroides sp.]
MTKAIIFDMGGVLVDLDLKACSDAFKQDLGFMKIDEILDACHQKGIFSDLEQGLISADDFRSYVLANSRPGCTAADVDKAVWAILLGIAPEKADLLRRLSLTHDIYMLSNNNPIAIVRAREIFEEAGIPMDFIFKKCYCSYQMKMLKPSREFYDAVAEDIAIDRSGMLFIDDSLANVEAALAAGIPSVHYRPGESLSSLVEKTLEGRC